jgi:hypothetical protein
MTFHPHLINESFESLNKFTTEFTKTIEIAYDAQFDALKTFINCFRNISPTFDEFQRWRGEILILFLEFRRLFEAELPFLNEYYDKIVENQLQRTDFAKILLEMESLGRINLLQGVNSKILQFLCYYRLQMNASMTISKEDKILINENCAKLLEFYTLYSQLFNRSLNPDLKNLFEKCRQEGFSFNEMKIAIQSCIDQNKMKLCNSIISCYKNGLDLETFNFFGTTLNEFDDWLEEQKNKH